MIEKIILGVLAISIALPLASSAHYIVGIVEDAQDGTLANGHTVMLWDYYGGQSDNLTDVVGPTGNSGNDDFYLIDCELLSGSCGVGDVMSVQVVNDGDDYVSEVVNVSVTGAGFDVAFNLSLNSPPEFQSVVAEDLLAVPTNEIDLLPATTKQVNCTAIVTEYEGDSTLVSATAEFFDSALSFYGDSNDNNTHYSNSSCAIDTSYGTSTEAEVVCSFDLWYYANQETWTCVVEATDNLLVSNSGNDSTLINPLLSIGVDSPINFGELNSSTVSNELEINVTNYGNVEVNLSLSGYARSEGDGYAMNCSSGINPNISVVYEKYNLSASTPGTLTLSEFENLYVNLTSSPEIREFNLNYRQNEIINDADNSTYWRIYLPSNTAGSCDGNIIFGGVQASGT